MMRSLNLLASVQALPRDLRLLFFSLFLWTFGLGVYNYVWSIYLRNLGALPEQVGLVYSVGFIAAAASMIPGGLLANKYELRALIIISWAMSLPPPITFYYAHAWPDVIPGLLILQVSAFSLPAFNAYISTASGQGKMASSFGAVYAAAPLGIVLSPALGSLLLNWLQIRDLFIVSFVFFTLSTLVLFLVKRQPALEADRNHSIVEFPKSSLEKVILLVLAGDTIAYSITSSFLPLYFQDVYKLTSIQIQLLGAVQSLGGAALAILLGRWASTRNAGGTMAAGFLLVSGGAVGISLTKSPFLALPMVFLFGTARAPSLVGYSILGGLKKGGSRGGRFGLYLTFEQLGFVIGSFIGGFLYAVSPLAILVVTFASFLTLAGLSLLGVRKLVSPQMP